jgi:hypothetical protein
MKKKIDIKTVKKLQDKKLKAVEDNKKVNK